MTRRPHPCRAPSRRRGNALVEAALVLPILLTLTFGGIEYGYFFFVKNAMQNAARTGARAAIAPGVNNAYVTARVAEALKAAGFQTSATTIDTTKFTVTYTPATISAANPGDTVTVRVSCTWGTVGIRPLPPPVGIAATTVVAGSTVMRKEGSVD